MEKTTKEYTNVMNLCREIFENKSIDYGTSWRILRSSSLTDQIFIKAQRIRTIQETGENKVGESFEDAFMAIVNYCIMSIIQLRNAPTIEEEISSKEAIQLYSLIEKEAFELMCKKNHDYGEAWRDMSQESFADLIIMKLQRIKQILANDGKTIMSEGIDANYVDILNYSVFALILM